MAALDLVPNDIQDHFEVREWRNARAILAAAHPDEWREKGFDARIVVDGDEYVTPTHKVDCYIGRVALEVEWNNKDPLYDRDLNNFRLLFELRAIDVGVIVTRSDELQEIFADLGRAQASGRLRRT